MLKLFCALTTISVFFILPKTTFADNQVLINEFLAHPSSGSNEWVEFYNPNHLDLSTYYLDDDTDFVSDSGSSSKKNLSSLNNSDPTYPYLEFSSFLNNSEDYVVLFASDGSIVDQYQYTEDPGTDISLGRSPDGSDDIVELVSATKGSPNSNPQPSPLPSATPEPTLSPSPTPTKAPSPSPTPAKSPIPTPKLLSPSPKQSPQNTPQVLGVKEENTSPSPLPTPEGEQGQSTLKVAGILTGAGAILIALSIGFYLWYSKVFNKPKNIQENSNESPTNGS